MKALITGGNGFLGSSLAAGLRAVGTDVRVVDPAPPRNDMDWSGIDYVRGTLDDTVNLAAALQDVDCVYHLASSTVPSTSNLDPARDVSDNLIGSLNLIAAMRNAGTRRILFFSSGGTVYGDPDSIPVPESHPLRPISSYGVVKVAIEQYLMMHARLGHLDPLILRPSNPYGPRQSTAGIQGAISAFLGKALTGDVVKIWGDGETVRDYIYVDDLVQLAVTAGLSDHTGIYNAGSGKGYSLNQICAHISQLTGKPLQVDHAPGRDFDVTKIILNIDGAQKSFAWTPQVTLADGLERTWRALQTTQPK